jgi:hypothetical protein
MLTGFSIPAKTAGFGASRHFAAMRQIQQLLE